MLGRTLCEQQDHPLDLPPAAEMVDIAELAAALGARRRLAGGEFAEASDQVRGVGRRGAVGKVDISGQGLTRSVWSDRLAAGPCQIADADAQRPVNRQKALAAAARGCHGGGVSDLNPGSRRAGGALLAGAILVGALGGILARQPSIGFLAGLGAGLLLLGAVWLADRR